MMQHAVLHGCTQFNKQKRPGVSFPASVLYYSIYFCKYFLEQKPVYFTPPYVTWMYNHFTDPTVL